MIVRKSEKKPENAFHLLAFRNVVLLRNN